MGLLNYTVMEQPYTAAEILKNLDDDGKFPVSLASRWMTSLKMTWKDSMIFLPSVSSG